MRNRPFLLLLAVSTVTVAGLVPGGFALGSVGVLSPTPAAPKSLATPRAGKRPRGVSSYTQQAGSALFARLRPVDRDEPIDFDEATALLSDKTINEKIFNKDFENKMRSEYANKVSPVEKAATDPLWRPSYFEMQKYDNGRHDLAQWTTREVMEDQLKDFFAHGDKDSAGMKALSTARALTGGEEETKPAELTAEEKAARAHRADLAKTAPSQEEEKIPTKLKTKLNVLRQNGSIVFSNPVAIASVNGSRDNVSADLNREFRKLTLKSKVAFQVKDECLNVNVNKKVTDHVTVDLDHYSYTGDKRDGAGYKVKDQAKVNYSISF